MVLLDNKIELVKRHFQIFKPEDWTSIPPGWITGLHDVGQATLNRIRIYLAARDITLKDDATVEYWQKHFGEACIGSSMTESDHSRVNDFTVLVDSQEKIPFTFGYIMTDATKDGAVPLIVPFKVRSLGIGRGDYSIDGMEGRVHIERKSKEDAHGTFLGWSERRERFERELEILSGMESAAVVVECSLDELLMVPARGKKTTEENAKILHRTIISWQQDFVVQWCFCGSRRMAEMTTFRWLERFWRKQQEVSKRATKKEIVEPEPEYMKVIREL